MAQGRIKGSNLDYGHHDLEAGHDRDDAQIHISSAPQTRHQLEPPQPQGVVSGSRVLSLCLFCNRDSPAQMATADGSG